VTNAKNPKEVGFYDTPGWAFDVDVVGNTAYVADAFAGVRIIDVSNRSHPTEKGAYDKHVDIHNIAVVGNTVYAGDRKYGLRVIELSNGKQPNQLGCIKLVNVPEVQTSSGDFTLPTFKPLNVNSYRQLKSDQLRLPNMLSSKADAEKADMHFNMVGQIGGATQAVTVVGNYAYVGVGLRMEILDVSNPADIRQVGATVPFPYFVEGVAVSGTLAYLAVGDAGLRIVDISDPTHPVEVGAWDSPGYAEGIAVAGNIVYLTDGPYGLWTVDVSDTAHPRKIGSAYDMNYAYGVALSGSYALIAAARAGLLVVDISDPVHPVELVIMDTPGNAIGVAVSGNLAYVADGWNGLQIVDITVPEQPVGISSYKTPGSATGVSISGTLVYVADAFKGLRVLDVSDINHPKELSGFESTYGNAAGIIVAGSMAYLADRNWGLRVINVSNPVHLVEVGSYKTMASVEAVDVTGNYAYVVSSGIGLRVVDVSDPAHPKWLGATDIANPNDWHDIRTISVAGNYAYVGVGGNIVVADISNPINPFWIETVKSKGLVQDITIVSGIAYVADELGLQLVDLSDPAHPSLLGHIVLTTGKGNTYSVAVSGTLAYLIASGEPDSFHIVDVSDPNKPTRIGGSSEIVWPTDVAVVGNWAYVLNHGRVGVSVVNVLNPAQPQEVSFLKTEGDFRRITAFGSTLYIADGDRGLSVVDVSDQFHPVYAANFNTQGYSLEITLANNRLFVADGQNGLVILEQVPVVGKINTKKSDFNKISVTSSADDGPGTFRQCIINAISGDTITFDPTIFPLSNPTTITLSSDLPPIIQGYLTIDASDRGVILDGSNIPASPLVWAQGGLSLKSDGNAVIGLQIVGFPGNGVLIEG
ncbi:MAG: hypothetical protein A2V66_07490, partial [Ignavibacteria bacterium RBG_13_36_8]